MKDKYKIIAIILFVIWLPLMWKSATIFSPKEVALSGGEEEGPGAPAAEQEVDNPYLVIIEQLKSPYPISRYKTLFDRNIFIKQEARPIAFTPDNLTLLSAEPVNLPFMYKGYIQTPMGAIIAQINWGGKTYFVKKGDRFKDFRVMEIDKKMVRIEGKEGQLILDFKKPVKGKEFIAKLSNSLNSKISEVRKGDEIYGYKILDITPNSVILYGEDKEWVINKGR